MGRIVGKSPFVALTTVPGKDKEFDSTPQGMDRGCKTARTTGQSGQIVPQFSIIGLNGVGLAFVSMSAPVAGKVDERFVDRKGIGIILFGLRRTVEQGLHGGVVTGKNDVPADNTAAVTVYVSDDVRFVFLAPMKVNSSSNSLTTNGCSGTGGLSGSRLACAVTQFATVSPPIAAKLMSSALNHLAKGGCGLDSLTSNGD